MAMVIANLNYDKIKFVIMILWFIWTVSDERYIHKKVDAYSSEI